MEEAKVKSHIKTIQYWRILVYILLHCIIFGHQILFKLGIVDHGNSNAADIFDTLETGTIRFGTVFMLSWFLTIPIFGRLLCGWACHMGALQEFGYFIITKLNVTNFKFRKYKLFDSKFLRFLLPSIVFFSLAIPAVYIFISKIQSLGYIPIIVNFKTNRTPFNVSELELFLSWFLVGFIFVGMFGKRPVCRFLCPFATVILRPFQKLSIYKIRKTGECVDCDACSQQCAIGIDVSKEIRTYGYVKSSECVSCFKCIDACNFETLSWGPKTGNEVTKDVPKEINPFHQVKLTIFLEVIITISSLVAVYLTRDDAASIIVIIPVIMCFTFLATFAVSKFYKQSA